MIYRIKCNEKRYSGGNECYKNWNNISINRIQNSINNIILKKLLAYTHRHLFMNTLSVELVTCNTGCYKNKTINHFINADDLIIFSPTIEGLKLLHA